jgi:hypothetical protein
VFVPIPVSKNFPARVRAQTTEKKGSRGGLTRRHAADTAKIGYRCHEMPIIESFFIHETAISCSAGLCLPVT